MSSMPLSSPSTPSLTLTLSLSFSALSSPSFSFLWPPLPTSFSRHSHQTPPGNHPNAVPVHPNQSSTSPSPSFSAVFPLYVQSLPVPAAAAALSPLSMTKWPSTASTCILWPIPSNHCFRPLHPPPSCPYSLPFHLHPPHRLLPPWNVLDSSTCWSRSCWAPKYR